MIDAQLSLNEHGFYDISFNELNDVHMVTGLASIEQSIKMNIYASTKEWFLNEEDGIDYPDMWSNNPIKNINDEIIKAILKDDRVSRIESYKSRYIKDKRQFVVTFKATTLEGVIDIEESL